MPDSLREQIAHATRDALSEANRMDEAYAPRPSDPPLLDRQTLAVADAVLPLVEAEREAERLRLHTQLRDLRERVSYQDTALRRQWVVDQIDVLLGVAATPQPEEQ